MKYRTRAAAPSDEKKIRELFLEMLRSIYHIEAVKGYDDGYLDKFWPGNESWIYVAEDKEVIAFLSVEIHHAQENYIYLDDFSVTEAYRNKGIGTKLLNAAESYARERNIPSACLHADKMNALAMRLYERSGYSIYRDEGNRYLLKKDLLS